MVRTLFRASRIGRIRIGNTQLYQPIRRNLYRLIWKFAAPDLNKPLEIQGQKICGIGPQRGGSNGMGLLMDSYEEGSTRIFNELTRSGMVVIDIGAHIGYYTLLAAKRVGLSGRVYAFEPETNNYQWLLKNIEMNGHRNVTPVNKAVADKTGSLKLWLGNSSGTHSICSEPGFNQKSELVEVTTIDDFLESEGWPSIGVIKIDAEGAEPQVFRGMQRLLSRQDNLKIIFEFNRNDFDKKHPNYLNSLDYLQSLQANGFTLHFIDEKKTSPLSSEDILSLCSRSIGKEKNLLGCKGTYEN